MHLTALARHFRKNEIWSKEVEKKKALVDSVGNVEVIDKKLQQDLEDKKEVFNNQAISQFKSN